MTSGVSELAHVLVLSDDIDAARDFYERAVGLRTGDRPPLEFAGYWLYAGDAPCLHIADRAAYAAHARTLGLTVGGTGGHSRSGARGSHRVQRLRSWGGDRAPGRAGIDPVRNDVPGRGPRQFSFDDPDGLRVEINVK